MYTEDELLSLSGLQHIAFCERQWALIHLEQQWEENYDTVRGALFHERAHTEGYSSAHGIRSERGVRVWSGTLGIIGIADIVEYGDGESVPESHIVPVEYKVGKPKVEEWDRIQVAAQAMCLEEMHHAAISVASLFYGETRRRETVPIDDALRRRVGELSEKMHGLYASGRTPKAEKSRKCLRCSLQDVCVPECLSESAAGYWEIRAKKLEPLP